MVCTIFCVGGRLIADKVPCVGVSNGHNKDDHTHTRPDMCHMYLGPPVEVTIRIPFLTVVYFSSGTLPPKRVKGPYWGT